MIGWGNRSDPQKSLSIMLRDKYGTPEIDYPIFPGHPITSLMSQARCEGARAGLSQ